VLWHAPEVFGGAAIPSGYRGTFTVLAKQAACGSLVNPDGTGVSHVVLWELD
jgi:hypothetical protein